MAFVASGRAGSAPVRCKLHTVPFRWIMARGDVDSSSQFSADHMIRNRWGRRIPVTDKAGNAMRGHDFSHNLGESFTQKPSIVADENALLSLFLLSEVLGNALTDDTEILNRKVFANNSPPAGRSEFNGIHREPRKKPLGETLRNEIRTNEYG